MMTTRARTTRTCGKQFYFVTAKPQNIISSNMSRSHHFYDRSRFDRGDNKVDGGGDMNREWQ